MSVVNRADGTGRHCTMRAIPIRASTPRLKLGLAALGLAAVLGVIAVGIAVTHAQSRNQILANFSARGKTSADFVSTYLSQQAARERQSAKVFLSGRKRLALEFDRTSADFGSEVAGLFDRSGRAIETLPHDTAILGTEVASKYSHLREAESGHTAVSGVVLSAVRHEPVVAIAVPFQTPYGRRVFSPAYPVAGSVLTIFVNNALAQKHHRALLIDASGMIIAASPRATTTTLHGTDPELAAAVAHRSYGEVKLDGQTTTFVVAPVAGAPWRIVLDLPNGTLFGSIDGWAMWLPWLVFAAISILALTILLMFSRSLASRSRLEALTTELAEAARTDALTGLANRRSLEERLAQASAYANRYQEPLSALMIDVDHFKHVNDSRGHDTGDEVLRAVADCMRTSFRDSDNFGRWGGDEFLALIPGSAEGAALAGERLCAEVRALDVFRFGLSRQLTLSIGCAMTTEGSPSPHGLLADADEALYRAKQSGRDQVAARASALLS